MSDDPGCVWVRTMPDPAGRYHAVIEFDDDTSLGIDRTIAVRYVMTLLTVVRRAEHDAAVMAQMKALGATDPRTAAELVVLLRKVRSPLTHEVLEYRPGVSAFTGKPFIHLIRNGKTIGQWTLADARSHAMGVLEAVVTADLDTEYRATLIEEVGLDAQVAESTVEDLGRFLRSDPGKRDDDAD